MRDAYNVLFECYPRDEIFSKGINDVIFVEERFIEEQWERQKEIFLRGGDLHIRGYSRDGNGTDLYMELYKILIPHVNIKRDSSNNSEPTKTLKSLTDYAKKITKKENKQIIRNYTIAHLFGRTKNPLLFNAAWNLAYVPEYLDPFTGHESSGDHSIAFKSKFEPVLRKRFAKYINDYNLFVRKNISENVDDALKLTKKKFPKAKKSKTKFETFRRNSVIELSEIQ
jgi:hypothetical protein